MGAYYITELADVLRNAWVAVVEYDGWKQRARGSGGYDAGRPWAIMWHHTASSASPESDAAYCCYGSPDEPITNILLDRTGVAWVLAAGATNTNGKGGPIATSRGTVPTDSMNSYALAIEIANNGVGEPYPKAQIDAAFAIHIALSRHLGLAISDLFEHWDWSPGRKIDPATGGAVLGPWQPRSINSSGTWNVDDVRAEAVRRANLPPPPPDPIPDPTPDPIDAALLAVASFDDTEDSMFITKTESGSFYMGNGVAYRQVPAGDGGELDYLIAKFRGRLVDFRYGSSVESQADVSPINAGSVAYLGVRVGKHAEKDPT